MVNSIDIFYAKKLRSLRLSKDIKQLEAARLLGLKDQQSYSKIENGQVGFSDDLIISICKAFSMSPAYFTVSIENEMGGGGGR